MGGAGRPAITRSVASLISSMDMAFLLRRAARIADLERLLARLFIRLGQMHIACLFGYRKDKSCRSGLHGAISGSCPRCSFIRFSRSAPLKPAVRFAISVNVISSSSFLLPQHTHANHACITVQQASRFCPRCEYARSESAHVP